MTHYLHHILFDPLSWWEQTKAVLLLLCVLLPLAAVMDFVRTRR